MGTLGLIGSAADGVEKIRPALIEPAIARGWQVAVTLTPTAGTWLQANGELQRIEDVTGLPCRTTPRLPTEDKPHPPIDCYLVCPATANTVAKLALGLADNQALTAACEVIGARTVPVIVVPKINTAHAGHPAWTSHVDALRSAGVLVLADDPLPAPGTEADRDLPWTKILDAVASVME
ncbi:flavoprotein [Saccharopolyspora taberi]|uniref:Flavoprotein n=1 Tax=Saccharopolyspora taberi TaxID=60895 RepID=A0ABN3VLN2_9PSEU